MPVTVVANTNTDDVSLERLRFIDIAGAPPFIVFDDLEEMKKRCQAAGVKSLIITGTSLRESRNAVKLAKEHDFYATVGCHPTRSTDFDNHKDGGPEGYLHSLETLISSNLTGRGRVVALGELGLDYDRTHHAPIEVQKKYFRMQLSLAKKYHLPMFLHSRAAHHDFVQILTEEGFGTNGGRDVGGAGGVVHSFTGTAEEAQDYFERVLAKNTPKYRSSTRNSSSMDHVRNRYALQPQFFTPSFASPHVDAPWCSCTSTHASKPYLNELPPNYRSVFFPPATQPERFVMGKPVKGRNEPTAVGGVAWVVYCLHRNAREEALARGEQREEIPFWKIARKAYKNTIEVFKLQELADA
ncbi:hypothetical protein NP233_g12679 [Leucocoprinus birnbaumii]|uniref:Mg-dependent DNase n=1 Tax=Leucocoprinus birnbaumii TaxID=56174 RepID=A0AAD5VFZ6_9AGAR|nr:hypothetical protein NP233_g12679 [Leucocoprinus birnbaumii]